VTEPRDTTVDDESAIATLNGLVETCKDGERGFGTAAAAVNDVNLKRLFDSYARQRGEFARELQREVRRLGGDPERAGHVAGALHRGWINFKAAVSGKDDGAVLDECERGEDMAVRSYREALERGLPADVRLTVERQFMQVKDAHDHVRTLETIYGHKA
jgi:uncharacterized protein (TIGR02284 family)